MLFPSSLHDGDRIAIISPASVVNPDYIDGAVAFFRSEGFEPVVMPHAKGPAFGSYAASDADRASDLISAYRDPSIRAILCARGGYGCNHLLPLLPADLFSADPKWLIGFSDVSALHAASLLSGGDQPGRLPVASLHAPMAKHLATLPPSDSSIRALMHILTQGLPITYEVPSHPLAIPGHAEGTLVGGNLAVINGLADTPYDPLRFPGPKILFIEDVSEQIYAVERMLIRMQLSGRLSEVTGIVCGQFTEYRPDRNFSSMEAMLSSLFNIQPSTLNFNLSTFPLALSFPSGHTDHNLPLVLGSHASLNVTPSVTTLSLT